MGNGDGLHSAPRLGSRRIERPRLDPLLDRVAETGILLVSAGAGYGKTTALSSWALGLDDAVVAWVNCGEEHDDPRCLSLQLAAMLHEVIAEVPIATVGDIADAVGANDADVVIVLDDAHRLSNASVWSALQDLVQRRPDNLRLIVSGRDEGGLPWHLLRSRGEVSEIHSDDLCFMPDEAVALLATTYGIGDAGAVVDQLLDVTQGWAVGLCLAGHALRHGATEVVHRPELGRHRYLRAYFDEELLVGLEQDHVRFLELTSVLERLDPDLCDLITGRSDSHALLESLVEHNLFTERISTCPPVFRYHQLFGDFLRSRMGGPDQATVVEQLAIASRWYEERGLPNLAIEAAFRSGDIGRVELLIRAASGPTLRAGFPHTVVRWLSALPAASIDANPDLALLLARSAGATGDLLAAQAGLAAVDSHMRTATEPVAPSLRLAWQNLAVVTALWIGDIDASAANLEVAEAMAAELGNESGEEMFGFERAALRAYGPLVQLLRGELRDAVRHIEQAITPGQLLNPDKDAVLAVGVRALAMAWAGESDASRDAVEQCRVSAAAFHGTTGGRMAMLTAGVWTSDLDLAESDLAQARAIADLAPVPIYRAVYLLAETRFGIRAGRLQASEESLAAAHKIIAAMPSPGFLAVVEHELRSDVAAAASEIAEANLNERELAVLRLLATGKSRREAAAQLYLSVNTIKTHLLSAYRKLSVSNRSEAIERARALGMLDQPVGARHAASLER